MIIKKRKKFILFNMYAILIQMTTYAVQDPYSHVIQSTDHLEYFLYRVTEIIIAFSPFIAFWSSNCETDQTLNLI